MDDFSAPLAFRSLGQQSDKLIKEGYLSFLHLASRFGKREKLCAIHFRKTLDSPGSRRPLHFEFIAANGLAVIVILLGRPSMHKLAALLLNRSQRQIRSHLFHGEAYLFLKLTNRGGQQLFAGFDFTLGNCPAAVVTMREEWPARMGQKDFELAAPVAIDHQSSADPWTHESRLTRQMAQPRCLSRSSGCLAGP